MDRDGDVLFSSTATCGLSKAIVERLRKVSRPGYMEEAGAFREPRITR